MSFDQFRGRQGTEGTLYPTPTTSLPSPTRDPPSVGEPPSECDGHDLSTHRVKDRRTDGHTGSYTSTPHPTPLVRPSRDPRVEVVKTNPLFTCTPGTQRYPRNRWHSTTLRDGQVGLSRLTSPDTSGLLSVVCQQRRRRTLSSGGLFRRRGFLHWPLLPSSGQGSETVSYFPREEFGNCSGQWETVKGGTVGCRWEGGGVG